MSHLRRRPWWVEPTLHWTVRKVTSRRVNIWLVCGLPLKNYLIAAPLLKNALIHEEQHKDVFT